MGLDSDVVLITPNKNKNTKNNVENKLNGYEAIRQKVDDGNTSVKNVAREPKKVESEKKRVSIGL